MFRNKRNTYKEPCLPTALYSLRLVVSYGSYYKILKKILDLNEEGKDYEKLRSFREPRPLDKQVDLPMWWYGINQEITGQFNTNLITYLKMGGLNE